MAVNKPDRMTANVRRGLLAPYDSWSNRRAVYQFIQDIPTSPTHPSYETLVEIESRLPLLKTMPWMFIWGMRDWCFKPQFLERFLDFYPKAEVHRLADAGHYVIEDAYEEIIPLVDSFLNSNPLEAPKLTVPMQQEQLTLGQCAAIASIIEVTAPKPGNVHRGAGF